MSTSERYRLEYVEGSVYSHILSLVHKHRLPEGDVVLDLGCGFGEMAELIGNLGLTYLGLDIDAECVRDLVSRGFEAAEVDLGDVSLLSTLVRPHLNDRPIAAIMALNFLEHVTTAPAILEELYSLSVAGGRPPLIISVPNATHIDLAAKLLIGRFDYTPTGLLDHTHVTFYSPAHLTRVLTQAGWSELERNDYELSTSDQHFPADVAVLAPSTPIHRLLLQIRDQAADGTIVNQFVRAYAPIENRSKQEEDLGSGPFLSVLMRTQGRRGATFVETLLSLAAQTTNDFEVLVLAHNVGAEALAEIRETIHTFDDEFSARVRVLRVEGGGRARPLNVGIAQARGAYIAVLDDDDMAFADWVEVFRRAKSDNLGNVIRARVAEQPIESVAWDRIAGYTPQGAVTLPFPETFDLWQHMFENQSPFCGFAFPRSCFIDMGIRFDESLAVVEDWDVMLQAALLCGVKDCAEVTTLYRRWRGAHSSLDTHSADEWHRARDKVLASLDQRTIPLPPGSLSVFHRLYDEVRMRREMVDHLVYERNAARDESSERGARLKELEWQVEAQLAALHTTRVEREIAIRQADRTQRELLHLQHTLSWRITKPVRGLRSVVGRLRSGDAHTPE